MTAFWATVAKVQTLVDGGIRIYLDLPEGAIMAAAELMAYKREGVVLGFEAKPMQQGQDELDQVYGNE